MVEVQKGGLSSLQQNSFSTGQRIVHNRHGVANHRCHSRCEFTEIEVENFVHLEGQAVVHLGENGVLLTQNHVKLFAKDHWIEQVLNAKSDTGRLVGVRRPNAALGCAEGVFTQEPFNHTVQLLVVRHDQVSVAGNDQSRSVDAFSLQRVNLLQQHRGINHDTVTNDWGEVRIEHTRGDELQGEGFAVNHDAVTGIVTALIADDHIHFGSEEVGKFALTLVTPLGSDDDGCWHENSLSGVSLLPPKFRRWPGRLGWESRPATPRLRSMQQGLTPVGSASGQQKSQQAPC